MSWFRRKNKRRRGLKVPEFPDSPIVGYVTRLEPSVWEGVRLPKEIGSFDYVENVHDLEAAIQRSAGGGRYRARVFDAIDKTTYLGTITFEIPWYPLMDGEPIKPKKDPKSETDRRIEHIEKEMKLEKLQAKLEKIRREMDQLQSKDRTRKRAKLRQRKRAQLRSKRTRIDRKER